MGCNFDFAIQVLIAGQWLTVLSWQGKTPICGGLWVDAAFKAARRGACPAYGEPVKLKRTASKKKAEGGNEKRRKTETPLSTHEQEQLQEAAQQKQEKEEGEEEQKRGQQQEQEGEEENRYLYYSRAGLDTLIECADPNRDRGGDVQMFKEARKLCDLYLACPPGYTEGGEWTLGNAGEIIAKIQKRQQKQVDVTSLPLEDVLPIVLSNIVRAYLDQSAEDVRFWMCDEEGSSEAIREAYDQGTVPEPVKVECVIS